MKYWILLLLLLTSITNTYSQASATIDGIVTDTLQNPLISSTVLLLEQADSTMVGFTTTSMDGSFRFNDVVSGNYIVKATYIGYVPKSVNVSVSDEKNIDLGTLAMIELAEELMEVVIKAAKAPIKMRGDTIEYDATTFQVPEGSTVEDLLRRLPGIEVNQDGSIDADGKEVTKVTVDGKSFFGSDPKAATKNLPAEGISKVQVFDSTTEEEEVTGLKSADADKTMNLELKEEFKRGGFGKVVAGIGTESRAELKGNYNKFNETVQFSLVGVGNNTGRNGLSWNDYRDFMGSQSFNFSFGNDYGFGSGSRMYVFGGGGNSIENNIQSIFFGNNDNGGLPENYNTGVNLNYQTDKTKLSGVYFYNQAGLAMNTINVEDKFFSDFTINDEGVSESENLSRGHRTELELEYEIDTLNTIKIEIDGAYIDENNDHFGAARLEQDGIRRSANEFNYQLLRTGYLGNAALTYRKKFKKKGRRFGANVSYLITQLDDDYLQESQNFFYRNSPDVIDSLSNINQLNINLADKSQLKGNLVYVEPLTSKIFLQTFYNHSNRNESGDRDVVDIINGESITNQFLTRSFNNTIELNRVGTALRYNHKGKNISLGLGYQSFDLSGSLLIASEDSEQQTISRVFSTWIPHFNIDMSQSRNSWIEFGFDRNATEPNVSDLQPIIDNRNPFYIREGNPTLVPELSNEFSFSMRKAYPLSGVRWNVGSSYTLFQDQFSTDETVDDNLISYVIPINVAGGTGANARFSFSFPIVKNKFTATTGTNVNWNERISFVNTIENTTNTRSIRPNLRLSITPNKDIGIYLNGNLSFIDTQYDINTSQDQKIFNQSYSAELNSKLFLGFYLNSNFSYNRFTNDRFGFDEDIPILNVSLYRHFLEGKKLEARISIYDSFNRNIAISQNTYNNIVSRSQTNSLGRYLMLNLTYNIRGIKTDLEKRNWW